MRNLPNNHFRDPWEDDFDRNFNRFFKWGVGVWVGVLLANLIIWGVAIWALIELVQWVKTK